MNKIKDNSKFNWLFVAVAVIGVAARLLVAACGHNFDMDSWRIVADIVDHGGNVYAGTDRYNYGPVWFNVLHALNILAGRNPNVFRWLLVSILTLADVGIFFILWRKFGKVAATFFLLNPVSIIITGYHNQFDNLAILLGLLAALLVGDEFDKPIGRRKCFGLLVLGISLATKHILFAFPCWLAVKQKGWGQKLAMMLIPVSVFVLGFVPYWREGGQGIVQNIFLYQSHTTDFFYRMFLPQFVQFMFGSRAVWLFLLVLFAFIYRRKNTIESLLLYTAVLVAASPASLNEYLAIPGAFVATHLNPFTILYTIAGAWHLLVDVNGLHLTSLPGTVFIDFAFYLLCLSLAWVTWRHIIVARLKQLLEWCISEAKNQLGFKS